MEKNKCYGFLYQGRKDWKPVYRQVMVEQVDGSSVLGRLVYPEQDHGAYRRFRFDSMKSSAKEIK